MDDRQLSLESRLLQLRDEIKALEGSALTTERLKARLRELCAERARLEEGLNPNAILVPQQGVTRTPRGDATVLVVGADDKVETRPIVASQAIGDKWLVTEGLKAGDRVVISGLQKVRPGVQVKAQEVTADNNQQAASGAQPEQSKS